MVAVSILGSKKTLILIYFVANISIVSLLLNQRIVATRLQFNTTSECQLTKVAISTIISLSIQSVMVLMFALSCISFLPVSDKKFVFVIYSRYISIKLIPISVFCCKYILQIYLLCLSKTFTFVFFMLLLFAECVTQVLHYIIYILDNKVLFKNEEILHLFFLIIPLVIFVFFFFILQNPSIYMYTANHNISF